ncbi:MAG: hypothetical protein FJ290_23430 [Planctomycetes bacterium]|nr:hypothetical protein [Planctomycetota bacterium]
MTSLRRCLSRGVIVSLLVTIPAQVLPGEDTPNLTREALAQIENLKKQHGQQKGALDELAARHARSEVLRFYEFRCGEIQQRIRALQAAIDGWKAKEAGDEARAKELLRAYESFKKEDARRAALRQYCEKHEAAQTAKEQPRREQASRAIGEMERGWDEASRSEARAIAKAYVDMRAAQSTFDLVEFARLMVKRRVIEDRVNVLDRALYHMDNLKGGHVPNADFDRQYDELWRKLLGRPAAEVMKDLSSTVATGRQAIHLAGEKLAEAKRAFILSYFGSDMAVSAMALNQLTEVARGTERGCALLKELGPELDALEAQLQPILARLGYDSRLEQRRPIKFDRAGNPSDVVFILDSRAKDYVKVLEGDATTMTTDAAGASILSLQLDEKGSIPYKPSTGGPPDVSKGELYQSYLVVLLGGNTNRGLPESFWKEATKEMLAQNAAGDRSPRTVEIWHPRVREFTGKYFEAVGRALRREPRFLLYDHVTWEPSYCVPPKERKSPTFGYAIQPGRSELAIKAFRDWLRAKFRTIERLNAAWGASYKSFDEISPPPDPFMEWRRRATPLSYEHETFLHESVADYVGLACGAIRKADPDHPVIFELPGDMDNSIEACFANVPLLTRAPAQMVEMHKNNFWPALPVQVYAATVIPMYGRIPVHTEFIWNWGRRSTPTDESQTYYQGLQTIWRNVAHGIRVLFPFAWDEWPSYENGYTDCFINKNWHPGWGTKVGAIYRDAIACLAVGARRARRLGELLRETKLGPREVAVVQPSTSTTNAYPY